MSLEHISNESMADKLNYAEKLFQLGCAEFESIPEGKLADYLIEHGGEFRSWLESEEGKHLMHLYINEHVEMYDIVSRYESYRTLH